MKIKIDAQVIGDRLKKLRGDKKAEEVSKSIGISKSALSMYENGFRIPRDKIKVRLAQYYKQTIQSIFFD